MLTEKERIKILSEYLEEDIEDFEVCDYDAQMIEGSGGEYLVLTDIEADNRAYDRMRDTLWAFNASFLWGYVDNPNIDVPHIKKVQELYEDANPILEALIGSTEDLESMFDDAMGNDGRGYYVASYDHDEIEVQYACPDCGNKREYVYIYRVN